MVLQKTVQYLIQKRLQSPEKNGSLHISCVIDRHFNPILTASNVYKSALGGYSVHAERNLIQKIGIKFPQKVKKFDMLVIRVDRNGNLASSRPCDCCLRDIIQSYKSGIKFDRLFYSNEKGDIVEKKIKDLIEEPVYLTKFFKNKKIRNDRFGESLSLSLRSSKGFPAVT